MFIAVFGDPSAGPDRGEGDLLCGEIPRQKSQRLVPDGPNAIAVTATNAGEAALRKQGQPNVPDYENGEAAGLSSDRKPDLSRTLVCISELKSCGEMGA